MLIKINFRIPCFFTIINVAFILMLASITTTREINAAIVEEIYFVVDDTIITKIDFEKEKQFVERLGQDQFNATSENELNNSIVSNMIAQRLYVQKLIV